jgi:3',5'-cyclic AMP phosphodiesterase CpdA
MIRILHLSDLHICSEDVRPALQAVLQSVGKNAWIPGSSIFSNEFSFHDQERINALVRAATSLDPPPDLICISGDITTFGDKSSFEVAKNFVTRLQDAYSPHVPQVVVIPGNHDNFEYAWSALLQKLKQRPLWQQLLAKLLGGTILTGLKAITTTKVQEPFANYKRFLADINATQNPLRVTSSDNAFTLSLFAFNSVNIDPLWMNTGILFNDEWERFKRSFPEHQDHHEIRAVVVHHNPFSAPQIKEHPVVVAYNSTIDVSGMLEEMQHRGVDLLLCGHQHSRACYSVDFPDGRSTRLWVSHAPAALLENSADIGYVVVDCESRYEIRTTQYHYKRGEYARVGEPKNLFLDAEPIKDDLTHYAHSEFRQYLYKGPSADPTFVQCCNDLVSRATDDVVIIGQTLRGFSRPAVLEQIVLPRLLKGVRFYMLVMDPEALLAETSRMPEAKALLTSLRDNFPNEATASLERLTRFQEDVNRDHGEPAGSRINIGKVPGVVPVGLNLHTKWNDESYRRGEMYVEILPVGNWRQEAKARFHLEQRCDYALYSFYFQFARRLVEIAKFA